MSAVGTGDTPRPAAPAFGFTLQLSLFGDGKMLYGARRAGGERQQQMRLLLVATSIAPGASSPAATFYYIQPRGESCGGHPGSHGPWGLRGGGLSAGGVSLTWRLGKLGAAKGEVPLRLCQSPLLKQS